MDAKLFMEEKCRMCPEDLGYVKSGIKEVSQCNMECTPCWNRFLEINYDN